MVVGGLAGVRIGVLPAVPQWRTLAAIINDPEVRPSERHHAQYHEPWLMRWRLLFHLLNWAPQECGKYLTSAYLLAVLPKDLRKMCVLFCRACSQAYVGAPAPTAKAAEHAC